MLPTEADPALFRADRLSALLFELNLPASALAPDSFLSQTVTRLLSRLSLKVVRSTGPILLLVLICFSACQRNENKKGSRAEQPLPPRKVKVHTAMVRPLDRPLRVVGVLRAFDEAVLGTKVSGRLEAILVDLGDEVKKGQELARIEPRDYELEVKQAEAALIQARAKLGFSEDVTSLPPLEMASLVKQARAIRDEAEANFQRIKKLSEEQVVSTAELETVTAAQTVARARYDEALEEARNRQAILLQRKAELEIAQQKLSDTTIRAPFPGRIQQRFAQSGEFLQAGSDVVNLVRVDPLRLQVEVPDRQAGKIHLKQKIVVKIDGNDRERTAEISRISPAINESNRVLIVEADLKNDGTLYPGAFARAEIMMKDPKSAVTVPREALAIFAGLEKVFIEEKGKAVEKRVTTGLQGSNWVEIAQGLKGGERVVLQPGGLQNGQPLLIEQ